MAKQTTLTSGISVAIPTEIESKVKSAFYAERDSFQEDIKKEAKRASMDVFEYYVALMLESSIEDRYEYALSKREKVLKSALSILISTGMSEETARKSLGLGE